jgi:hypothetical protein
VTSGPLPVQSWRQWSPSYLALPPVVDADRARLDSARAACAPRIGWRAANVGQDLQPSRGMGSAEWPEKAKDWTASAVPNPHLVRRSCQFLGHPPMEPACNLHMSVGYGRSGRRTARLKRAEWIDEVRSRGPCAAAVWLRLLDKCHERRPRGSLEQPDRGSVRANKRRDVELLLT